MLAIHCRAFNKPIPETEFRFDPKRRWRFDYAFPSLKIAVEQEGGIWSGGRHTRGAGYIKDLEKYNTATKAGWRVFRFTPQQIQSGDAFNFIEDLLHGKP
jgi:very-short-patch-repair endonuclease